MIYTTTLQVGYGIVMNLVHMLVVMVVRLCSPRLDPNWCIPFVQMNENGCRCCPTLMHMENQFPPSTYLR
jgi:hypothetical protein